MSNLPQDNYNNDVMRKSLDRRRSAHTMSAYMGLDVHSNRTYATILDGDRMIGRAWMRGHNALLRVDIYMPYQRR